MQIIKSQYSGFCFGVKRTLAIAQKAAEEYGRVYSLGPLIHNPQEVARLREHNIIPINDLDEIDEGYLIIRSHGVRPAVFQKAVAKNLFIIDGTCPLVKKAQKLANDLYKDEYQVVIVGDKQHPEVIGIRGWTDDSAWVVENTQQADELPYIDKIGVVVQTTQKIENFSAIVEVLQRKCRELKVHNTICNATSQNQKAARELVKNVDVVFVIGGKNSSNTLKLAQICSSGGIPAFHLETACDLLPYMYQGKEKIGITAGASTPDWIIEEVIGKMSVTENGCENNVLEAQEVVEETCTCGADAKENLEAAEVASENQIDEANEDTMAFQDAYHLEIKEVRRGARVKGTVVQVKQDEILVDIGGKSEGVLPCSELTSEDAAQIMEKFHVGDEIEVLILKRENQEGYPVLSKKRIDQELAWDKLAQIKDDNQIITGKVLEVVKGGLLVDVGLRGFVPASLVSLGYVEDLAAFVGQNIEMKVIECERNGNKLVLSAKAVLKEKAAEKRGETLASIAEGQTRRGIVRRLTNFGAFVDIGGVDGLLHVSEMAWYRVNHPSDLLKEGDELDVYVLGIDQEHEKISLGLKQLIPNPWTLAKEKYPEGTIIQAKVMRTAPFGAFLEVEPGVEGLVHISQLAHERVEKTEDVVKPGDVVDVRVLSIDPEAKRISLSIKATLEAPAEEKSHEEEAPFVQEFSGEEQE
ncbi:MAG: bifunctional 4-hydroxy-3-methylbut-2-enyl diphosphate reductase/30S ribosomal protein S1 [Clostridiales bacterium]